LITCIAHQRLELFLISFQQKQLNTVAPSAVRVRKLNLNNMPVKELIQYDLDAGRFNGICSNEETFKSYVFKKLDLQRQMIINKISKRELEMGDGGDCTGNDYLTAKQLGLDEAIEIIKSIK